MENDLEQQVAKFFTKVNVIRSIDCRDHLIGLLQQTTAESDVALFTIPRTAFRRTKGGDNGAELFDGGQSRIRRELSGHRFSIYSEVSTFLDN